MPIYKKYWIISLQSIPIVFLLLIAFFLLFNPSLEPEEKNISLTLPSNKENYYGYETD